MFLGDGDSVKVTQLDEELGHVGLAQPGSPKLINSLLENGYLPVVSSIGVTDEGQLMNVKRQCVDGGKTGCATGRRTGLHDADPR